MSAQDGYRLARGCAITTADKIELAGVIVIAITLLVQLWQTIIQNRLSRAHLLRDRFEMYWRTYEPVPDQAVSDFHLKPTDYISQEEYDKLPENDDKTIRKYIMMAKHYEYLAFLHTLKKERLRDPMGDQWLELWTKFYMTDREFLHIHENYQNYYPDFAKFVDELKAQTPLKKAPPT